MGLNTVPIGDNWIKNLDEFLENFQRGEGSFLIFKSFKSLRMFAVIFRGKTMNFWIRMRGGVTSPGRGRERCAANPLSEVAVPSPGSLIMIIQVL